jgi:Uma2 family endonuclease
MRGAFRKRGNLDNRRDDKSAANQCQEMRWNWTTVERAVSCRLKDATIPATMPVLSTTKMTAQQFLMLGEDPPGLRLELVDGEVAVSPSPTPDHSHVVVNLITILNVHIQQRALGELHHDVDTILDRFNVRRPDILYFSAARTHLIGKKAMEGPPDLAIEVLSPSSIEVDREDKFKQYRDAGVANYWIVDPVNRTIEAWRLEGTEYARCGRGEHEDTVSLPPFPDLRIPLSQLWRRSSGA